MSKTLLITFGCSWTYGVGVNYESGMSSKEMYEHAWDSSICDALSWRALLSQKFDLRNLNLAKGGSSNQRQFRMAVEFFGSPGYTKIRQQFQKIVVLWGITSTARNELWSVEHNDHHNFCLSEDHNFARFICKHCYDHDAEVFLLRSRILFWNRFFESLGIQNFWFDTFNSHNYNYDFRSNRQKKTYQIDRAASIRGQHYHAIAGPDWPSYENFCLDQIDKIAPHIIEEIKNIFGQPGVDDNCVHTTITHSESDQTLLPITNLLDQDLWPRDLMSILMMRIGFAMPGNRQQYHISNWYIDRDGMEKLVEMGMLNPYSLHPTKQGHSVISDYFEDRLRAHLI